MATHESRRPHLALLICILLLYTISPILVALHNGVLILNILGAGVLLAASYALSERRYLFGVAIVLSAISICFTWRLQLSPTHTAVLSAHTCIVILVTFFSITILGYVLRGGKITADKIFAAICVYMLIAYAWSFAYALLAEMEPGAFTSPTPIAAGDYIAQVMQMRYFSFMTLTTVGYGDIVPHSPAARTMAGLEAVMGQLYLVALVGRLVGLHIVHSDASNSREKH